MPLLRMREATFADAAVRAGPVTLELGHGERAALCAASPREAAVIALLAAGIVKASSGCVLIGDFDPRVQSAACKRLAAFVPHEPFVLSEAEFARYVDYRAALWNVEPQRARTRAASLRRQLAGMHETLAFPLIAALVATPKLIVLDRPPPVYAKQIVAAIGDCAALCAHVDSAAARAFAPLGGVLRGALA